MESYEDDYPTCAETFTIFASFSEQVSAAEISRRIGIEPSESHAVGDPIASTTTKRRREHGWFLSSQGHVVSRDFRKHLDWLLDQLEPALPGIERLRADGASLDLSCYWVSASGQGGPIITSQQKQRLARFGVDVWWDIYFGGNDGAG